MIPVLLGIGAAGFIGHQLHKRFGAKTLGADHEKIYNEAMSSMKDPSKLRHLAQAFDASGFGDHGNMLRKRAALRELPPKVKADRRAAFKKGMRSKDPIGIEKLALEFDKAGAWGSAAALRKYAKTLPQSK